MTAHIGKCFLSQPQVCKHIFHACHRIMIWFIASDREKYNFSCVTCSAIWGLLDKDYDLRASYELMNTGRIL